jgi:hypothetical protein
MRKIMRGFSLGIECIVKGLMWIHRKSGINGILVIAILIAPVQHFLFRIKQHPVQVW